MTACVRTDNSRALSQHDSAHTAHTLQLAIEHLPTTPVMTHCCSQLCQSHMTTLLAETYVQQFGMREIGPVMCSTAACYADQM